MKIFMAGDSTASIKEKNKRPETGWGEKLHLYLSENIEIINSAQNGRSTKSFIDEGRLEEIERLFKPNDLLFIQFGHNDEKEDKPERYTNPEQYKKNLTTFINAAKSKGVKPIIMTSVSRRKFLEDNKTIDPFAIGKYPSYAKEVALKENVLCLDLFSKTKELYEYLGFEESKKLFLKFEPNIHPNYLEGIDDNTHFNDLGATIIASLIAEEVANSDSLLQKYIDKTKLLTFKEIKNMI
ncbi:MAG TPA: rhamnogalacturonan acetylesterase [Acholeplasmataceae bacterium]|nr:rhamnogalacturonan acetylesterase [Acholeplasmataceae bacterium]